MRRLFKMVAWVLLALAGIAIIAYLLVAAINRNDRPQAPAAKRQLDVVGHAPKVRDPDDGRPFNWDADTSSIVFAGLEPARRGRHALPY